MKKRKHIVVERRKADPEMFISSGCTILNLRLTGHPDCAFKKGTINNFIGDSFAGKTFLLWTMFAEACNHSGFDKYDIEYNEPEKAFEIDIKHFFGAKAYNRVIRETEDEMFPYESSPNIEQFGKDLPNTLSKGPAIIGLDSYDALDCLEDNKKEVGKRNFSSKPRILTDILRRNVEAIEESGSILNIISQQRDKMDAVAFGSKKRRAGGHALKFYSTIEYWLAVYKSITKDFRKQKEEIGNIVQAKVTKNKITGKKGKSYFPIMWDYGVDDILSQIHFLTTYNEWKKKKGGIITTPWGNFKQNELIHYIENKKYERKLKQCTTKLWRELEKHLKDTRKKKY